MFDIDLILIRHTTAHYPSLFAHSDIFTCLYDHALHVFFLPLVFGISFNALSMCLLLVCMRYLCIARSRLFLMLSRSLDSTKPCRLRITFVEMLAAVLLKN